MPDTNEIADAIMATRTPYWELQNRIPAEPGLYSVFVDFSAELRETTIANHPSDHPIYVGKSQVGLQVRHLEEHFAAGRTGSSTVRRSFAALLRTALGLNPIRRGSTGRDQDFVSYKLDEASEERLNGWMTSHLVIGWWVFTGPVNQLKQQEVALIGHFQPPLNLQQSSHPVVSKVKSLRAQCATLARTAAV